MTRSTEECEMSRSCHKATFQAPPESSPQHTCKSADLLAGDRILLVRHGRGALLLLAEVLLCLANLRTLQVANLHGDLVERTADNGNRPNVRRMPIALDNLRGNGGRLQPESHANTLFVFRLQMAEGAHRARKLADTHFLGGSLEACRFRCISANQLSNFSPKVVGSA